MNTKQYFAIAPIGDDVIWLDVKMPLRKAQQLNSMIGQVFVLKSISWTDSDTAEVVFEPGNGMLELVEKKD